MLPIDTDVPYLEPLLNWLQDDPTLKDHFSQKSYFMPQHELLAAVDATLDEKCPAPKSIWIIPADGKPNNKKPGCPPSTLATFHVVIFVQCIRDTFYFSQGTDTTKAVLNGQAMELYSLRKLVRKSVEKFATKITPKDQYQDVEWNGYQTLYPEKDKFLATAIEFTVKILP